MASLVKIINARVDPSTARAIEWHMGDLRRAIVGGDIDPEALSAAEKLQWAGWGRRDEVNGAVRNLHR